MLPYTAKMIERKPVPQQEQSPQEPSLPSALSSPSNPHSPEDIRAPSPASPTPQQEFYDAPEVVPGTAPEPIPEDGTGDYGGEKLTLGPNTDPSSSPEALYNNDPASQPQTVVGSSPVYSSINSDPKSAPQALNPTMYDGKEEDGKAEKRPWWKRKVILLMIVLGVLVIAGLAVGLGVGLTHGKNDDGGGNNGGGDNNGGGNQGSPE